MAEPILVARRRDAGAVAGGQGPVVQLRAEVAGMDVRKRPRGDPWWRAGSCRRARREGCAPDPATSIVPFTGAPTVTAANAATTSSEEIGCMRAGETRTVCPTVLDWAMRPTNSKNWVARRWRTCIGAPGRRSTRRCRSFITRSARPQFRLSLCDGGMVPSLAQSQRLDDHRPQEIAEGARVGPFGSRIRQGRRSRAHARRQCAQPFRRRPRQLHRTTR